jgi:hypothetical protein
MKSLATVLVSGAGTFVCAALAACAAPEAAPQVRPPTGEPAMLEPTDPVTTYFAASDQASSRLLRAAFHPTAQLLSVDDAGAAQVVTQLQWWQRLDAIETPMVADSRRLEVLDREGPLVLVEAVSTFRTHTFDDLLLVARTPDGWRIVGKAFERLEPGAPLPGAAPGDEDAIRAVLGDKIEAHAAYDPALLARSHTPTCLYAAVGVEGVALTVSTLSEAAFRYARRHESGEDGRASRWRILRVEVRGRIAAVKLDVVWKGRRYVDHLLLLKLAEGWRIAAAAWGDPAWI